MVMEGKRRFEPNTFRVSNKRSNHYATQEKGLWITDCFDQDIAASSANLLITSEGELAHSVVGDNILFRDVRNVIFINSRQYMKECEFV